MNIQHKKSLGIVFLVAIALFVFFKTRTESVKIAGFEKADIEQLLKITGVTYDGTVPGLVQATQKAWLRPAGKERWEAVAVFEDKRSALLPLFKKMGLVEGCSPCCKSYDYILFMGATVFRMESRMEYLQKILQDGIAYREIVF